VERSDFSKIYWINRNIARWERKLEELEAASPLRSASNYQLTPAYGTNLTTDNVAKEAQRRQEIKERIERLIDAAHAKKLEIYGYIDEINEEEPYMAAVIEERCIKCKTWIEVADTLGGSAKAHEKAYHRYIMKIFPAEDGK